MKRSIVSLLTVLALVSMVNAQFLIGGRGTGMGGTGVAASRDIDAAYYNPACLMKADVLLTDIKIALGAKYTNLEKLTSAFSKSTDPAQFLLDNYAENLNFSGNVGGIIGINARKLGISVLPLVDLTVNKNANSLAGTVTAAGAYTPTLTLGTTFSVPYLPAALHAGVNIKSVTPAGGNITATLDPLDPNKSNGNQDVYSGSGMGYDIGLLTTFDVPMVSTLQVGAVMRNLATSYTLKTTRRAANIDKTTGKVTLGNEQQLADQTVNVDSSTAIGAYTVVPGVGLGVAADIEMARTETNTHFGLEYPLLLDTLLLRAGYASGPNLALTSYGLEVDLRFLSLSITGVTDSKNSGYTYSYADVTIGF